MLALVILFQMAPEVTSAPRHITNHAEFNLQLDTHDTAFDDYLIDRFPGLLTAKVIIEDMKQQLDMVKGTHPGWGEVCTALERLELCRLQRFWVFLKLGGHHGSEAGPAWAAQRQRALAQASLGSQRAAGDSKKGLDHLTPPKPPRCSEDA